MGPGRPASGWRASAAAVAVTALLALFMGSGIGTIPVVVVGRSGATMPERIVYTTAPPSPPPAPTRAPVDASPRPAPPPAVRPRAPSAEPARTSPPPARDSLDRGTPRAAPGVAPRAPVAGMPVRPSLPTLPAPASPRGRTDAATCAAPCAAPLTVGPRTGPAGLDSAGRAGRLRELGASVPELARELGERVGGSAIAGPTDPGGPPAPGGVSIAVGLPGGGPTKAQRARDRKLHAANMAMMARVRARVDPAVADSLRADSLARADSVARSRRPP